MNVIEALDDFLLDKLQTVVDFCSDWSQGQSITSE
jgi:hypothetical protein